MTNNSTNSPALQSQAETAGHLLDDWFDPIEAGLRDRVREFIQGMIEAEVLRNANVPRRVSISKRLSSMRHSQTFSSSKTIRTSARPFAKS